MKGCVRCKEWIGDFKRENNGKPVSFLSLMLQTRTRRPYHLGCYKIKSSDEEMKRLREKLQEMRFARHRQVMMIENMPSSGRNAVIERDFFN